MGLFSKLSHFKLARYAALIPSALGWALEGQLRNRFRAVRSYRILAASGLFDPVFYTSQPGYVADGHVDPLQHYLLFGSAGKLDPNPLFDTSWYLAQNPDVASSGINPLVHFSSSRCREKRNPHPLFDVAWYLDHNPDVAQAASDPLLHFLMTGGKEARSPHPLFDSRWYFDRNPDVAAAQSNPLVHYLRNGWKENRDPHPLFHTHYYLAQKPELIAQEVNPLEHFVMVGFRENLNPNHLFNTAYYRNLYSDITVDTNPLLHYLLSGGAELRRTHPLFDPLEYSRRVPRLLELGTNPLLHYFQSGIRQKLSPHCLFDVRFYLSQRPELISSGEDPVLHYFEHGEELGLDPCELFDTSYYLARYPKVRESGQNALVHFITEGAFQGYNPNPLFDTLYYLKQNGDVAATKQNALAHYMQSGAFEGRSPSPFFDSLFYLKENPAVRQARVNPLAHFLVRGGAEEGKDPNSFFKTTIYLKEHPEIAALGINPLVHFIGAYQLQPLEPETNAEPPARLNLRFNHRRLKPMNQPTIQEGKTTVICVSHVSPVPPRAGNEYRLLRLLQWLKSSGYNVIPVLSPLPHGTISDAQIAEVAAQLGGAVLCSRDGAMASCVDENVGQVLEALSGAGIPSYSAPFEVHGEKYGREAELLNVERTFCHDALIRLVTQLANASESAIVLVEYVFMSRLLPLLPASTLKIIDTHDVFSFKQKKVVARGVSDTLALTGEEEAQRLSRADLILAIQPEEQAELEHLSGPEQQVITVGVDFPVVSCGHAVSGHKVLFIGSENPMNAQGLRDFLRFAWPAVLRAVPDAELLVAGKVCNTLRSNHPQVSLLGSVERLDELYDRVKVVINPALAGTGLKIKTLEALSFLRPLVTWPTGTDGLHPKLRELCLLARDWFEFAEQLIGVLNDSRGEWFTSEQIDTLRTHLSARAVYSDLDSVLKKRSLSECAIA